jgi:AraC-like DNA-binding protein
VIRAFRRRFGISPMAYRAQAKLRWASGELAGGRAVKEVARYLGFADASAFSRAFRRQFGLSPSELRVPGASAVPKALPQPSDTAFPMNRHVMPPDSAGAWFTWG